PRTAAPTPGAVIDTTGGWVSTGGGGGVPAAWAARSALTSGSGIPSWSGVVPNNPPTSHCPWPAQVGAFATAPSVHSPVDSTNARTCAGVSDGFAPSTNAAAPATWGAAMLVPLSVVMPPSIQSDWTCTPGAATSTTDP